MQNTQGKAIMAQDGDQKGQQGFHLASLKYIQIVH